MRYEDLNDHFKERVRVRVERKIAQYRPDHSVDPGIRDYVVGVIILLADENNFVRAAERLREIKQANLETACSLESALETVAGIYQRFEIEVSILYDLYRLQKTQTDILDVIAHMEMRLLEP
ncbi:MAG TPA: hypothetical protein VEX43_12265 [Chthoniobacterales bacterium]|nr:hypothetical protein [Chthoniobacterales bacterium]